MDNEENKPEAGQKVPDPIGESIERMKAVLDVVEHKVREARFLVTGMESNQLKWATLSRTCGMIHDLTRLGWQKLTEKPEVFHTPKEILDFVTANPPLGEVKDAPTPLDQSAPEMVQGGGAKASVPHRKAKFVIEIGGVEFVREVMEGFILYHGAHSTPGGHNPKQWAMEVYRSPSGVVRAVAYNGGDKPVMNISGRGNFKVLDRMAVNALGGFVRAALKPSRIHKSARRTAKAAETEGEPNV